MLAVQRTAARRERSMRGAVTALSLALALGLVSSAAARVDGQPAPEIVATAAQVEEDETPIPSSVAVPVSRVRTALKNAKIRVHKGQYAKALYSLKNIRLNVGRAHEAGVAQIGLPPTDPESDELPGPPSVIAVLGVENQVGIGVVGLFAGTQGKVVEALKLTLRTVHPTRDQMLDKVIALDPEGDGADYADGMADTVPIYAAEVNAITSALDRFRLTPAGRSGLENALTRVRATKTEVDAAFGGGE